MNQLILTVTRACDLRCAYCPTAKDGWPSLTPDDARAAVDLFAGRYGGGDVKLFGGEPLLVPEVVEAALDAAAARPSIRRIVLSTNGLGLTPARLERLAARPKLVVTLSMDGAPGDHRRLRRALPGTADAYDHVQRLLPRLLRLPRLVITQTIAPSTARRAADNFDHLLGLGFTRFNLLPGYFIPWRGEQLEALEAGFGGIARRLRAAWSAGRGLYLRNLFTRAPTPFFNTGLVVDADRSIHPSNVGLSGSLEGLLGRTRVGDLDDPPAPEALAARARAIPDLLRASVPPRVWDSTLAADAALTRLCEGLLPHWLALRAQRRAARRRAEATPGATP